MLVRSDGTKDAKLVDETFNHLRAELKDKVAFRVVEWNSKTGKAAAEQFSFSEAPASVVADPDGNVVMKAEGTDSVKQISAALEKLTR